MRYFPSATDQFQGCNARAAIWATLVLFGSLVLSLVRGPQFRFHPCPCPNVPANSRSRGSSPKEPFSGTGTGTGTLTGQNSGQDPSARPCAALDRLGLPLRYAALSSAPWPGERLPLPFAPARVMGQCRFRHKDKMVLARANSTRTLFGMRRTWGESGELAERRRAGRVELEPALTVASHCRRKTLGGTHVDKTSELESFHFD